MILGRPPAMWAALVQAVLNVGVVVFGIALTAEQVGALNGLGLVIIAIISGSPLTDHAALASAALSRKQGK